MTNVTNVQAEDNDMTSSSQHQHESDELEGAKLEADGGHAHLSLTHHAHLPALLLLLQAIDPATQTSMNNNNTQSNIH
jgi:hypothetical protein